MMDVKATAATLIILSLALLTGAVGFSQNYVVSPDCSSLQPRPCKITPVMDVDDKISYDSYEESCPYHVCIALQPVFPAASTSNTSSKISMENVFNKQRPSNRFPRGSRRAEQFQNEAARSSMSDSSEKVAFTTVYDSFAPWFCSVANINYTARVEANTGYPPGKKEDLRAQCEYERLMDTQTLSDCRHLRFPCTKCASFYQNWLCAMAFPKCNPDKTVTTYSPYDASDPNSSSVQGLVPRKVFSITKPCRGLCWGVLQRCQHYMNFNCPETDTRDYGDYPACNALGFDKGAEPYATKIYW